jgi:hypothetical protein
MVIFRPELATSPQWPLVEFETRLTAEGKLQARQVKLIKGES